MFEQLFERPHALALQVRGVAVLAQRVEGAPGHGEGHNGGMPLQIAAALAVKKVMEQQHLPGTLMLWPGVAEELVDVAVAIKRAVRDMDVVARYGGEEFAVILPVTKLAAATWVAERTTRAS